MRRGRAPARPATSPSGRTRWLSHGTELAAIGAQRVVEVRVVAATIVVLASAAWPAAALLLALAAAAPAATVRALREADLRVRSVGGVLAQLLADTLGGLPAVRAHQGAAAVTAWHETHLGAWVRAARRLGMRPRSTCVRRSPYLVPTMGVITYNVEHVGDGTPPFDIDMNEAAIAAA